MEIYKRRPTGAGTPGRGAARPGQSTHRPQQQAGPASGQHGNSPQPPPSKRKRTQHSNSRRFRAIIMVLCTIGLCCFLAIFILQSATDLFGLNQPDEDIQVTIPENATLSQVASILDKSGVIDKRLTFQIYAGLQNDQRYLAGDYIFNSNMAYSEILVYLRTSTGQMETVEITFVEGRNAYEYAQQLEEVGVCDAEEFLEYLETGDFSYDFIDQMPENKLRFRRLEGYLFPDTYEFYVGENVDSVIRKKFLSNFSGKITTSMRTRMQELNMTLDETITLASIIQKEAGGVHGIDEMKRVSSVFHNRMNSSGVYPKLQSDVTLHYVENFIIPFQDLRNQDMYDAYNTYECDGLPVGPISNPGLDAIEAALYPDDTEYYFFVTDVQDNFYYSVTAAEHYQKVIEASRVEGEGEIHGTDTR